MTIIEKRSLPDPPATVPHVTNDGREIGTLTFDKGTSRLELAPGQLPYRPMPSKRKHRGGR